MSIVTDRTPTDWITRFADEERRRSEGHARDLSVAAHLAEIAQFRVHVLMDALRNRVTRDVDEFGRQFPERAIHFEDVPLNGGFIIRREHYPEARLTVSPNPAAGSVHVEYLFASGVGLSMPRSMELVCGDDVPGWHFRNEDGYPVRPIARLSEYLLVPVFTGCPPKERLRPR
jgi:hypothetical protein